ncbi:MAG: aspartate kinase, partial [Nanoarchaeota archaeon]
YETIAAAVKEIPAGVIPIVTGFIGKTADGEITTLGRGGSDYTAAIYGAALDAEEIQVWTDVDGVMTADPMIVPNDARTVDVVSFEEASELAYFGAKVLHPKTIIPAMNREIPVRVLNTFNPSGKGTLILKTVGKRDRTDVTAITCKKNIYVININSARMLLAFGFLHHVFKLFDEFRVPVDIISTSEVNVSVTVEKKFSISELVERLKEFAGVTVLSDRASISVVGDGIKSTPGIGGRIFSTLGKRGINIEMTSQSYAVVNESIVIKEDRLDEAVHALHDEFFDVAASAAAAGEAPVTATIKKIRAGRNYG